MASAVEMAGERYALLAHLGQFAKAHHLIAAAVAEDRSLPPHEAMQATQPRNPLRPGPKHQVIGVAKDDVGTGRPHILWLHRLNRRRGPDRHKHGRSNLAALHRELAGS